MFQCHSPKSSHPLPLQQSSKDCSLHLCLFCCLAYRVIVTIVLNSIYMHLVQFSSVAQSCLTLCDPMNRSTPGLPLHHQLPEFTQTHVHQVSDVIQPSHPLSSPSPPILYWCFSFWLTSLCIIGLHFSFAVNLKLLQKH